MQMTQSGSMGAAGAMQFAYRELLAPSMGAVGAGILLFITLQYTVLGPLGTGGTMNWIERLGYWGLVGMLNFPVCYATGVLAMYVVRYRRQYEIALALAVMALLLAASCTAITLTVYGLFAGGGLPQASLPKVYALSAVNVVGGTALVYYVMFLRVSGKRSAERAVPVDAVGEERPGGAEAAAAGDTGIATGEARTAERERAAKLPADIEEQPATAGPQQGPPAAAARFFDRLPEELGGDIIYLAASAHYVDVITMAGSASILLRFSDAVAELGDLGIRVHRSYWVAYRHVRRAVRREGRPVLLLTGDHEVRVGRNYLPEVRAAVPKAWVRARRLVAKEAPAGGR